MTSADRGPGIPVSFRTLGCKVNRVESDKIAAELIGLGVRIAPESEAAVVVINTCTVTGEADAKARKAVRHALKAARQPVVVVTGCLAALDAESLAAIDRRVLVEPDKAAVPGRVADALALDRGAHDGVAHVAPVGDGFRTRAAVKIEDGCDNFCTYCIVPYARGVPFSVPLRDIVGTVSGLAEAGVSEVVLTGINIGRYRDGDSDLADVVRAVSATGVERLRLSSVEPPDLTPKLLASLAEAPALCEHLHVPLQSGSDAVLERMGRGYTTRQFEQWVCDARSLIDGLVVTTDVIAGFPGETHEEHRSSRDFIERMGFSKLHVFRYSVRPGTPAAELDQVAPPIKAARATELRELGDGLRLAFLRSREGVRSQVLVESVDGGVATGTTRDYIRVRLPSAGQQVGDLVEVTLEAGHVS